MNPAAIIRRARARHPRAATALLVLFFLLPSLIGIGQRVFTGSHYWFRHYEAVACAGIKAAENQPIYDLKLACEGMHATRYAYPPVVAKAMAAVQESLGITGATALYGGLFWVSAGFLMWSATFSRRAAGTPSQRAPFLALHTGYALFWGNIAILVHGAAAAAAVLLIDLPWVFAAAIVVASVIKPVFLTYVVVLAYAAWSPGRRALYAGATIVAGLLPTLLFMRFGGEEATQWKAHVAYFVLSWNPGASFFSWAKLLGATPGSLPVTAAYLLYAALLAGAGLVIVETARLRPMDRVWLGLTVASLLNPRLFAHDVLLLGPGMVVAIASAKAYSERFGTRLEAILTGICVLVVVLALLGGRLGQNLGLFACAASLITIGAARFRAEVARRGWQSLWREPRSWLAAPEQTPG